jgi:hypothetical protein
MQNTSENGSLNFHWHSLFGYSYPLSRMEVCITAPVTPLSGVDEMDVGSSVFMDEWPDKKDPQTSEALFRYAGS